MKTSRLTLGVLALATAALAPVQERDDRTLLTQAEMTAIINEDSGERAMHHLLELVLGKKMTALQIRASLSGELTPLALADVMAVLRARESAGAIKLVPRRAARQ